MAVVIETTIGDFTVDLFVDSRPQACKNFLKLCKMKYYNFCLFHSIQPNFLAQTGDPTGTGSGGESIYGLLYGENARYFEAEVMPKLKHHKPALLSMVNCGNNMLGSQFFVTLGEELVSLDGEHCVFGEITEGAEIVLRLNEAICDTLHRPYKDIRITHTVILEDPFEDPSGLIVPDMSPEATQERLANGRIGADEEIDETAGMTSAQVEELKQEREARARATILEIVGDLPDAEMAPPENVLFVCKLNPVTTDDDLEIIFSRFGKVKSCEVIRDKNTGDSLQYAFVEFEDRKSCEEAYFKMDNVLIDDRRIHVDFSQSVAKMRWKGKGRGVEYFDNKDQNKESKSSSHKPKDKDDSKYRNRRDKDYEEKNRRRDRGREREDDRGSGRDRGRDREGDDRHRRREDRDRSRSDWRKRDEKHRRDDHRDEDKRLDSKRREGESSRKRDREEESKRERASTSSTSTRRVTERKPDPESKELNGRSSSLHERLGKRVSSERDVKRGVSKSNDKKSKEQEIIPEPNSPALNDCKEENLSDSFNDSRDIQSGVDDTEKSPVGCIPNDRAKTDVKINNISTRFTNDLNFKVKEDDEIKKEFEDDKASDGKLSYKSDKKSDENRKLDVKKPSKRKRRVSEIRSRKKRRYSSSSDSSSESSDSSDSSSSSDSSDYRHKKKKKLIIAKKYYRGGKLVKEVKKKKRTKDTSESDSVSEESSESDSKRKRKNKKYKKATNIYKQSKRKSINSSDESQTESSSSDSDVKSKKKKSKVINKLTKKKSKGKSSKKKRNEKDETSSSSDSEDSVENKSHSKKQKHSHKGVKQNPNHPVSNTTD